VVPLEEITEIFEGPTSNSIIFPTNVEDLESLAIRVEVEVLQSREWIPGVITKIQKTKKVM
jgi:hypothetical protein